MNFNFDITSNKANLFNSLTQEQRERLINRAEELGLANLAAGKLPTPEQRRIMVERARNYQPLERIEVVEQVDLQENLPVSECQFYEPDDTTRKRMQDFLARYENINIMDRKKTIVQDKTESDLITNEESEEGVLTESTNQWQIEIQENGLIKSQKRDMISQRNVATLEDLKRLHFDDSIIEQYFDFIPKKYSTDSNMISFDLYRLKADLVVNNKTIKTIGDLVIALSTKIETTKDIKNADNSGQIKSDFIKIDRSEFDIHKGYTSKENLLSMGFTENEISEYFVSDEVQRLNEETGEWEHASGGNFFTVKRNVELNGRKVNSLDDLKYELFQAPIDELMNKVRAGVISQTQIVAELEKLGATNIEEKPIENDPLGRTTITYTYRVKTDYMIPQNLTVVKKPEVKYDENGEAFKTILDTRGYSFESLRAFGFTDSDLEQYFDCKSIEDYKQENPFGAKLAESSDSKPGYCYQLKSDIVIDGYEVKNVHELWYFAVLTNLQ